MNAASSLTDFVRHAVTIGRKWDTSLEGSLRWHLWSVQNEVMEKHADPRRPGQAQRRVEAWVEAHEGQPVSHREIAEALFLRRETVTRTLRTLVASGAVQRHESRYYVA